MREEWEMHPLVGPFVQRAQLDLWNPSQRGVPGGQATGRTWPAPRTESLAPVAGPSLCLCPLCQGILHFFLLSRVLTMCWVTRSCPTLCNPMGCSPPGSSVHGVLHTRVLEWVAISSSRGSSWPRNGTHVSCVSCIDRQILYHWCHLGSPSLDCDLLWPMGLYETDTNRGLSMHLWSHFFLILLTKGDKDQVGRDYRGKSWKLGRVKKLESALKFATNLIIALFCCQELKGELRENVFGVRKG